MEITAPKIDVVVPLEWGISAFFNSDAAAVDLANAIRSAGWDCMNPDSYKVTIIDGEAEKPIPVKSVRLEGIGSTPDDPALSPILLVLDGVWYNAQATYKVVCVYP